MTFTGPRNAFFTIQTPQYSDDKSVDPRDWKSLSITEELQKAPMGSIVLNDPLLLYDRALRVNAEVQVSFGYKANGAPLSDLFGQGNADLFGQKIERHGLSMVVLNPGGEGNDDGSGGFSCSLMGQGWRGAPANKTWDSGTKESVVRAVMASMGVSTQFVAFDNMGDAYSSESVERQSESDFQFLVRLSYEWRATFNIGHAADGTMFGIFFDAHHLDSVQAQLKASLGVSFGIPAFSWRGAASGDILVNSYRWSNEQGENGEGDNVQFLLVNGQPTTRRFTMQGDQVVVWDLDEGAVQKYVGEGKPIEPILNATSFKDQVVKQFWRQVMQTTAPNGLGYKVELHMLGHPELAPGMQVRLNQGFPGSLKTAAAESPVNFILQKVSHSIGQGGYFTDCEAVDMFTFAATGVF